MKKTICTLHCVLLLFATAACANGDVDDRETDPIVVRLAAPKINFIEDFDTNIYKLWLEEQTGLKIEILWLPPEDADQIAKGQLESGEGMPCAYVGFGNRSLFAGTELQRYGEIGSIIPLSKLIEDHGTYTKALWAELPEHNIEAYMTSANGEIYFMPGFSSSYITRFRNIMWVNASWLEDLGIDVPKTTEDFREMLRAFKDANPDAIPLAGTESHYGKQAYDWIINAFVYNDTNNCRLLLSDGIVSFAPISDEWREALIYMRGLFDEGLYSPLSFTQDDQQLKQMASDSRDILGAFLSPGITLTVEQDSPEMMERYVGIGPITGPDGARYATVFTSVPKPNGVITSACEHPEEVFRLFDLMLSEEACLMGRYGTRGEDWDFAEEGEVSIYGTPATISIKNQIWNTLQNKHLCQIVPYVSRPKFSGGVTWDGNRLDGEFINAQAALLYVDAAPSEYVGTLIFTPEEDALVREIRTGIEVYVTASLVDFITGKRDITSDAEWDEYVQGFEALGLTVFTEVVQGAVDRLS